MRGRLSRTLIVVGALALLLMLVLQSRPAQELVRARVETWLAENAGTTARIGTLDYSLRQLTVELRDVSLAPRAQPETPFFQAARIEIALDGLPLFRPVRLLGVDVERPRVTLVRDAHGQLNLPATEGGSGGGTAGTGLPLSPDLLVPMRVSLRHLDVDYRDEGGGPALHLADVSWFARRGPRGLEGSLTADGYATVRMSGRAISLTALRGRLRWNGRDVSADDVSAVVEAGAPADSTTAGRVARVGAASTRPPLARVRASVTIAAVLSTPRITLDGRAALALDTALRWLSVPVDAEGPISLAARAEGPLSSFAIDIRLEGGPLRVNKAGGLALASRLRLTTDALDLLEATVRAQGGTLEAHGRLPLSSGAGQGRFDATWTGLPLAVLARSLDLQPAASVDAALRGRAEARWPGTDLGEALLSLENHVTERAGSALAITGRANLEAGSGRWSLVHEHALGPLSVSGRAGGALPSFDVDRITLGGTLSAATDDLAGSARQLARLNLLDPEVAGSITAGTLAFDGRLSGTLGRPALQGRLVARRLEVADTPATDVDARVALGRARLSVEEAVVSQGQNRAVVRGDLVFASRMVRGEATAAVTELTGLWHAAGLPEKWQPRGRLDAALEVAGRIDRPRVGADLTGTLGVRDLEPSPVAAHLELDGRRLSVSGLRLSMPAGTVTGGGELDLGAVGRPFRAQASVALERAEDLGAAFDPGTWPVEGVWSLGASAEGQVANLAQASVDVQLDRVDGRVAGLPLQLEAPARLERRQNRLQVSRLALRSGSSRLVAEGTLGDDAPLRLTAEVSLGDLAPLWQRWPEDARPGLDGEIALNATMRGAIAQPVIEASVVGHGLTAAWGRLPGARDVGLSLTARDGAVTLDRFEGTWQEATFDATGRLPWRLLEPWLPGTWHGVLGSAPGGATLRADVRGLTTKALEPLVAAETLSSLDGRVSATASLSADRLAVEAVRGDIVLTEAQVAIAQIPLQQREPTRLVLANSRLQVQHLRWEGPGTNVTAAGGLAWRDGRLRLDAGIDASFDLRMASPFLRPASTAGRADVSITVGGPADDPAIEGRATVTGVEMRLRQPRLAITGLGGTVVLIGDQLRLEQVNGSVNGGTLTASGTARLDGWALGTYDIAVDAKNAALEFPEGLRNELMASLRVRRAPSDATPLLSGAVTLLHARYREQLGPAAQLFGARQSVVTRAIEGPSGPMAGIRLDVSVTTREDVDIEINYGRAEAGAALRVGGTVGAPRLNGRLALREGGELFLGGTTYRLESGSVDFRGGTRIEPVLDLTARTQVGGYSIELRVSGTPDTIRADLSSQPPLDSSDIVSLLVTGRKTSEGGLSTHVVGQQVLGYLSGDVLNLAGRAVGLDSVRIDRGLTFEDLRFDPSVIAGDTDPASRLTITKNLTRGVEVVLSQDLSAGGKLTWVATWRPRRALAFRLISIDEVDRTYEFRQELSFGAPAGSRASGGLPEGPRIVGLSLEGADALAADLRTHLKQRPGKRFNFYTWQDDRDRLLETLHERDYLEAEVSASREDTTDEDGKPAVSLRYALALGPRGEISVEGATLPDPVIEEMRTEWTRTVFDGFLVEDVTRLAREALVRQGYLRAEVAASVETSTTPAGATKVVHVRIERGPQTTDRRLEWRGNAAIAADRLTAAVARAGLDDEVWLDPGVIEGPIRRLYEAEGYLEARVAPGVPSYENGIARLVVGVTEGPAATIRAFEVDGARAISRSQLGEVAGLSPGGPFRPAMVAAARQRLEQAYFDRGFDDARVEPRVVSRPDGTVDIAMAVDEGAQHVLASVQVEGGSRTHPGLVRSALNLEAGQPLASEGLFDARRRLYETGAFRQVDVRTEPVGAPREDTTTGVAQQPMAATVTLEEWPRWRVRYGLQVNDFLDRVADQRDVGPGLSGEIERSNLFGRAATVGAAVRYESQRQAVRGYVSTPRFFRWPLGSTLFAQQEWQQYGDVDAQVTGLTFEQRYRLRQPTQINYGYFYRHSRVRTIGEILGQPFPIDVITNYGGLFSAVSLDRRDDPFNATRGWFHSSSIKYATTAFGSDLRFIKWVTQQSFYYGVGRRVVLASNARLGLADGFGQEIVPEERFFAGGTSSVRGYREDSLGPRGAFDLLTGGEALVVLNQELRFPVWRFLSGVAFVDAGNAFTEPSRIDLGQLEVGAGFGLRVSTPVGLLRFDFGIPVSQGGGLGAGRLHFAFGQVF